MRRLPLVSKRTNGARRRMRVLLVQPGRGALFGADFAYKELLPHVGLAYVAAAVRAAGHETRVIDGTAEGLDIRAIVARAKAFAPDVVAFTANTTQIVEADKSARAMREAMPGVTTILGGYHVSPIPEETLRSFSSFDFAVFGEGEHTLVELLEVLPDARAAAGIAGVCARDGDEILCAPSRPSETDLDSLPRPAYDLFPVDRYYGPYTLRRHRALNLTTARGCPYKCIFCQNPGGLKYRKRSIESVMEEIEIDVVRHGAELLFVTDETFTLDRKRVVAFCEAMMQRGLHRRVRWFCETRVDAVDRELLQLLRAAGCYSLFYGVESGNQETLDRSNKRIEKSEAIAAVRWAREVGIFTHTNYIFGNPFETRDTIRETIQFAIDVDSDAAGFSIMVPYPGTEILRMAREGHGGLRLLSSDWSDYGKVVGAALELESLPRGALERLQLEAYARFYLRPSKIVNLPRVGHLSAIPFVLANAAYKQVSSLSARGATSR